MQLTTYPYRLPLKSPFRIAHGSRTEQPTIIVKLVAEDGYYGLGEAPMTSYYGLRTEECLAILEKVAEALLSYTDLAPAEVHAFLDRDFPNIHPFLRCALDVAAHDLWAKRQGKRLGSCWDQPNPDQRVPTTYTISLGTPAEMAEKVAASPWPLYKIKLGTDRDIEIIQALRRVTTAPFRVDANTGWTVEQTLHYAPLLQKMGVEFIEQPLPTNDWTGYRKLYQESPLPIMADESCQSEEDVERCVEHFHGINIKIVKCGGLLPARRMIQKARSYGLEVMAGCMTESSVGISAIAQLVPELDYVDIDGALLLANDPAEGVGFDDLGVVQFPNRPGTGALLKN
ncbi:MAG: dipeptide epimerase [Bacteroidota bacterium]